MKNDVNMAFMFIHHHFAAALLNIQFFWEVMCCLVSSPQHSEGSQCLRLYGTA